MHNPPLILIADDDSDFRQIMVAKLTQSGFWAAEAKDGNEVIERARTLSPDLIVLDINMPKANGTEGLIGLKADPATKNIKVMFFSSLAHPWPMIKKENPEFAKEIGALDFINKSEDLSVIVVKIKNALGLSGETTIPAKSAGTTSATEPVKATIEKKS